MAEVADIAGNLWASRCNEERILVDNGIGAGHSICVVEPQTSPIECVAKTSYITDLMVKILKERRNIDRFAVVEFTTTNPLPTQLCDPNCASGSGFTELDRILPPHCKIGFFTI